MHDKAYDIMGDLGASSWWYRGRRDIFVSLFQRLVPAEAKVLDFGCGMGVNTYPLRETGFAVVAGDRAQQALNTCRAIGLEVLDLSAATPPLPVFDSILLSDVLEHVKDEDAFLKEVSLYLKSGGQLVVTVPAYERLWSGEDYVSQHYRRYTRGMLLHVLKRNGFAIEQSSYFNTLLFPLALGTVLFQRLFCPRAMYESNVKPLPRWLNEFFYRVFRAERHLLGRVQLPYGLSIFALAEKSTH